MIEVILPLARRDDTRVPLAGRPPTLRGGTLGFLDGWGDRNPDGTYTMYPLMAAVAEVARRDWGVAEILWLKKDRAGSPASAHQYATVVADCVAVVTGICLSGGCTAGAVADATTLEGRGRPTVTLCQDNFESLAIHFATGLGCPDLPLFVYPTPVNGNLAPADIVRGRAEEIRRALCTGADDA